MEKRRFTQDFTLTTLTGTVEKKSQKHGCRRSMEKTVGESRDNGPLTS